jgi:hypothetical protein
MAAFYRVSSGEPKRLSSRILTWMETLLGPSILFVSPPFCTGYAFHACRHAPARFAAVAGFVLSAIELLILVALMILGALELMN